jgi:hypothetical protein
MRNGILEEQKWCLLHWALMCGSEFILNLFCVDLKRWEGNNPSDTQRTRGGHGRLGRSRISQLHCSRGATINVIIT